MKHMGILSLIGILAVATRTIAAPASATEVNPAVDDEAYRQEIEQWHAERIAHLTEPTGWLSLIGLYWLEEGVNRFGSDTDNHVILPASVAPPLAGELIVADDRITLRVAKGARVLLRGEPVTEQEIHSDGEDLPDVLTIGDISFLVLQRGDRLAVRVKDPNAETRRNFKGIRRFPVNQRYRIEAEMMPYDPPKTRQVPTVIGTSASYLVPGLVRFSIDGVPCELEPVIADPESQLLFFIFADSTNGRETYGAGRFLYSEREQDGKVVVDFNRAINPPCAFTAYATCPLPPPQNKLNVPIEAGERYH